MAGTPLVHGEQTLNPPRPAHVGWKVVQAVLASGIAIGLLWWLIPVISGTGWAEVWALLRQISPMSIVWLTLLWLVGLLSQGFVLTGSMPGLSHRRALALNLTGSAVSNLAPMGGALGVLANLRMSRAWRFRDSSFITFTIVSNVWDVMAKLFLPLIALVTLFIYDNLKVPNLRGMCMIASAVLLVLLATMIAWLSSDSAAVKVEQRISHLVSRMPGRVGSRGHGLDERLATIRLQSRDVVRSHWHSMTLGMLGYLLLQAALLYVCLTLVHARVSIPILIVAFALERLGTLFVLTPGGVGVGEAATLAVLVALGSPGAETAAGLLLFRCFTFLIEIPVGGAWLSGWLLMNRGRTA